MGKWRRQRRGRRSVRHRAGSGSTVEALQRNVASRRVRNVGEPHKLELIAKRKDVHWTGQH